MEQVVVIVVAAKGHSHEKEMSKVSRGIHSLINGGRWTSSKSNRRCSIASGCNHKEKKQKQAAYHRWKQRRNDEETKASSWMYHDLNDINEAKYSCNDSCCWSTKEECFEKESWYLENGKGTKSLITSVSSSSSAVNAGVRQGGQTGTILPPLVSHIKHVKHFLFPMIDSNLFGVTEKYEILPVSPALKE